MQKQLMALKPVVVEYKNKRETEGKCLLLSITGKWLFQQIYPTKMNW